MSRCKRDYQIAMTQGRSARSYDQPISLRGPALSLRARPKSRSSDTGRAVAVPSRVTSAALIPANVPEYFQVTPGQVLNFISTSTSSGYTEMT